MTISQRTQGDHPTKTRPWVPGGLPLCCLRAFGSNQGNGGLLLHSWHIGVTSYKWSTLYILYPQMVYKFCNPFVLQKKLYPQMHSILFVLYSLIQNRRSIWSTNVRLFLFVHLYPQNKKICSHKKHTYFVPYLYPQIFCTPFVPTNIY